MIDDNERRIKFCLIVSSFHKINITKTKKKLTQLELDIKKCENDIEKKSHSTFIVDGNSVQ